MIALAVFGGLGLAGLALYALIARFQPHLIHDPADLATRQVR